MAQLYRLRLICCIINGYSYFNISPHNASPVGERHFKGVDCRSVLFQSGAPSGVVTAE